MAIILYVEDHPPAQMLMEAIISDMTAHELHVAGSGQEAEILTHNTPPDLYILDLDLPDTDGITLAKTLTDLHSVPVILVSAYAESVDDVTKQDVIHYYLAKPLDPDYVTETIQRALARSK